MTRIQNIMYYAVKWLLYIVLFIFILIIERCFIGITSITNSIAFISSAAIIFLGFFVTYFYVIIIPLFIILISLFWITKKYFKNTVKYFGNLERTTNMIIISIPIGFLGLMLPLSLLNYKKIKIINDTEVPISDIYVDYGPHSYDNLSVKKLNQDKTYNYYPSADFFKDETINDILNNTKHKAKYFKSGEQKTINYTYGLGITKIYLK
jgi:hypothetical protein